MNRSILPYALSLVATLVGSSAFARSANDSGEPADSAEIVGGSTDAQDPAVVAIYAQAGNVQYGCSGTLISPHVVLTAAHCVSSDELGAGAKIWVVAGEDASAFYDVNLLNVNDPRLLAVKEVHWDQAFNRSTALTAGHDVGFIVLQNAMTVTPAAYNKAALTGSVMGKPVRFVGYGHTSPTNNTFGLKLDTDASIMDYDAQFIRTDDASHTSCNGDSGGPAFADLGAGNVIVGIVSNGDCQGNSAFTRVDAYLDFINATINAAESGATITTISSDDTAAPAPTANADLEPRTGCDMTDHGQSPLLICFGVLLLAARFIARRRRA